MFNTTKRYHKLRGVVDVMVTEKGGKPLIPYIISDTNDCNQFESCSYSMSIARQYFEPDTDSFIQEFDMIFHSQFRDEFCLKWHTLNIPSPHDSCLPKGPTASSYYAYLLATKRVSHRVIYILKPKFFFSCIYDCMLL
jgi:hypothetical protein